MCLANARTATAVSAVTMRKGEEGIMVENAEEINKVVAEEIGNEKHKRKVRTDTLVYKMFGKQYNELTEEEQREYWVEKHKREMQNESKKIAKREYERERYKRRQEYFRARAKERYAKKKEK